MAFISRSTALLALALIVSGCTTKKTEPPAPSGPSGLATTLVLYASPDLLTQDGQSTSQITIQAHDGNNQPVRNLPLRAEIAVGETVTDFGTLSQKNLSTGGDGRATVVYTAPPQVDSIERQTRVTIRVTPLTGDGRGDIHRTVDIRLVPSGTVGGETPVPDIIVNPTAPQQLQTVTFDASDEALDGSITNYEWDFGDGTKGAGRTTSHQYRSAGTYFVTLTVTDLAGLKGSRSVSVAVSASGLPTASFVFSPSNPGIGEEIAFNAAASTAVAPRTIVSYDWHFGTDRTGSGMIVMKRYDTPGTYRVTLTVTDDAGNQTTTSQSVTVGTSSPGGLSPQFTFSPTSPTTGQLISFNASGSTAASSIVEYFWDFGAAGQPNSQQSTTTPFVQYSYTTEGTYRVTLRIKDSQNRTALVTQDVAVAAP